MKNHLHNYLLNLSASGLGLDFASFACRYGNFTIYCLMGPEENFMQVTFAPAKHERLQKTLKSLNRNIYIRKRRQEDFHCNTMFADYFAGRRTEFPIIPDSPLIDAGTDFQRSIWRHISSIQYSDCITYRRLAELAGSPKASRAAGTACGANPLALIIPCHRVVAVNGLGGFAGGVAVKKALLALERTPAALL